MGYTSYSYVAAQLTKPYAKGLFSSYELKENFEFCIEDISKFVDLDIYNVT